MLPHLHASDLPSPSSVTPTVTTSSPRTRALSVRVPVGSPAHRSVISMGRVLHACWVDIPLSFLELFPLWSSCSPPGPLSSQTHSTRIIGFLKHAPDFSHPCFESFSGSAFHSGWNPNSWVWHSPPDLVLDLAQRCQASLTSVAPSVGLCIILPFLAIFCTCCLDDFALACLNYFSFQKT